MQLFLLGGGAFVPVRTEGTPFLLLFHGAALACGRGSELRGCALRTFVARAGLAQAARVERPIAGEKPLVGGGRMTGVGGHRGEIRARGAQHTSAPFVCSPPPPCLLFAPEIHARAPSFP